MSLTLPISVRIDVRVQSSVIGLGDAANFASREDQGAQLVFMGVVRDHNQGRAVTGVTYDAFEPLAEKVLAEIAGEASAGEADILIIHRTGRLAVGEMSVLIVTCSRHRAAAYRASRHVIEEIKQRVPIWKQEHYVDGESEWLAGHALCQSSPESSVL